jgi:hypothetical protein
MGELAYQRVKSLTWASRVAPYEGIFDHLLPSPGASAGTSVAIPELEP